VSHSTRTVTPIGMMRTVGIFFIALGLGGFATSCGSDVVALSGCVEGQKQCIVGGKPTCEPIDEPKSGCGSPSCSSCSTQGWVHALATCNLQRECSIAVCDEGYADWTSEPGCETSLLTTDDHCGKCSNSCVYPSRPNATSACILGHCSIESCIPGFIDCNGVELDGCECGPNKTCINKACQ